MAHERTFELSVASGVVTLNVLEIVAMNVQQVTELLIRMAGGVSFTKDFATAEEAQAELALWRFRVEDAR